MIEVLNILEHPNDVLRKISWHVSPESLSLQREFIESMLLTRKFHYALGLAAPQVGRNDRIVVIDSLNVNYPGLDPARNVLVNPVIVERSKKMITFNEGCLSLPNDSSKVERHEFVKVQAIDMHGQAFTLDASGLLSVVVQHEIDHLDGRLMIDAR